MDREVFDRKYTLRLNPQQAEAVHAVEGAVLLLAVPGSGKTTVLVTRLGYMLCCCGIPADKILTMTYTKAATREMRQRFARLFGEDCPGPGVSHHQRRFLQNHRFLCPCTWQGKRLYTDGK